jgi:hypothetical protein
MLTAFTSEMALEIANAKRYIRKPPEACYSRRTFGSTGNKVLDPALVVATAPPGWLGGKDIIDAGNIRALYLKIDLTGPRGT